MKEVNGDFTRYCTEVLGEEVHPEPWNQATRLPLYLREGYDFKVVKLMDTRMLLAADKRKEEHPPGTIVKQLGQIRAFWQNPVVYVRPAITSYNRRRLIQQKIPFVVPGTQMYLPDLFTDLRERFKEIPKTGTGFAPATQVLLLHVLLNGEYGPLTPGLTAARLGYTPMTMTRAFAELHRLGIGEHVVQPKNRRISFTVHGRQLWEQVLPRLTTPVKTRVYLKGGLTQNNRVVAGLTALGQLTMLAEPAVPVYAVGVRAWNAMQDQVRAVPYPEDGDAELELWKYPPELFGAQGRVDRLSLFLSLREHADERVSAALREMLDQMPW